MSGLVSISPRDRLGWLGGGAIVGVLAAILVSPALASVRAADTTSATEHTIIVSGTGIMYAPPDTADISLGVSVRRPTAKQAQAAAATAMSAVVDALKAQGIALEDIQTTTISLDPVYDYDSNQNPPKLVGYQSSNIVSVTIRDLSTAGAVIDAATEAGANSIGGISFRVADQAPIESQARAKAMADAKAKADQLASAAGVAITGVVTITEVSAPSPTPYPYLARDAAGAESTPVLGGNVQLSVSVTVVYSIA